MLRYLDVELSSFGNVAFMSKCRDAEMSRRRNVELLRDVELSSFGDVEMSGEMSRMSRFRDHFPGESW